MKLRHILINERPIPQKENTWGDSIGGAIFVVLFLFCAIAWLSNQPVHPTDGVATSNYSITK